MTGAGRFRALDAYVTQRRAEAQNPALALALTTRHETAYAAAYGAMDLGSREPVTPDTLFQIGSVSKTFAAVAAMQAVEAGRLDLDAPLQAVLPWFEVRSPYDAPITAHHLLSHSAGTPY
ncbi:MAG: beta-lactamase family protein, partial [Anaerolineae bacterium]|nr:beta-lactamase family protein [Anaerolineae bacterium]